MNFAQIAGAIGQSLSVVLLTRATQPETGDPGPQQASLLPSLSLNWFLIVIIGVGVGSIIVSLLKGRK